VIGSRESEDLGFFHLKQVVAEESWQEGHPLPEWYSLGVWINHDDCVHAEEKVCKEME